MAGRRHRSDHALIKSYLAAFSSGNPETVAAHVRDDFVNAHLGLLGSGCQGKSTYLERLKGFLSDFKDLRYDVVDLVAADGEASARYDMHFSQDGKPFRVPGIMIFKIRDGLISHRTDCWDGLVYLQQRGADAKDIAELLT